MVTYTDNAGVVTAYKYDALGRRIEKNVGGTITQFLYDGSRVIEELDVDGTLDASYVYGRYIDEVIQMNRGGTEYYYHTDDMYNVMVVTDATGTVVERYDYDDYGNPHFYNASGTEITQSAIDNPYLFNGRRYDPETGFYYYRTRYLDPRVGRFTTRDTIGIWGDASNLGNGYTYVGNNPWSFVDPFGYEGCNSFSLFSSAWNIAGKIGENFYNLPSELYNLPGNVIQSAADISVNYDIIYNNVSTFMSDPLSNGYGLYENFMDYYHNLDDCEKQDFVESFIANIASDAILTAGGVGLLKKIENVKDFTRYLRNRGTKNNIPSAICFVEGTLILTYTGYIAIDVLSVGQRVITNDEISNQEHTTCVNQDTWRLIKLRMPNPDGSNDVIEIECLRSLDWIEENHIQEEGTTYFVLPEMGLEGRAIVETIEPCPDIENAPGRVILSTITHMNGYVYEIRLKGTGELIEPTRLHRLYSEDRQDWIPTHEFQEGERLRTSTGSVFIESITKKPGIHRVYNLEIETDHCYYVSEENILSHNDNPCGRSTFVDQMNPYEATRYERYWRQKYGEIFEGIPNTRERTYTIPGTRSVTDEKLSRTGEVYQRQTIYDEFGRKIGSNEFSVHGRPRDHTNPHHHTNDKMNPFGHSSPKPGLHPQTP
jgi:RHS repeat-associated protein